MAKKKYKLKNINPENKRLSKCGHWSEKGRYFNCENCLKELPEDDYHPDLIYFSEDSECEGDWNV